MYTTEEYQKNKDDLKRLLDSRGLPVDQTQLKWRTNPPLFPHNGTNEEKYKWQDECLCAILDALVTQGYIIAWPGDGTGCVQQIVDAVAKSEYKEGLRIGTSNSVKD